MLVIDAVARRKRLGLLALISMFFVAAQAPAETGAQKCRWMSCAGNQSHDS